jgi:hypothetical protein
MPILPAFPAQLRGRELSRSETNLSRGGENETLYKTAHTPGLGNWKILTRSRGGRFFSANDGLCFGPRSRLVGTACRVGRALDCTHGRLGLQTSTSTRPRLLAVLRPPLALGDG